MRNMTLAALAASSIVGMSATAAMAHISLQQNQATPGAYNAVLGIPHGCDGAATEAVHVEIPEGFIGVKPMPKAGWTIEIEEGDYGRSYNLHGYEVSSGTAAVTWKGGSLADDHYDEFTLHGTLAGVEAGQRLFFKTTQTCASGEEAWTQIPAPGDDPHAFEHPAAMLTILADAGTEGHSHHAASEAASGDLLISDAWARAMLPGQATGGAYMTIRNDGEEVDTLLSVTSPVAGTVEIHTMTMEDDIMVMRPLEDGLEIPAGESVMLEPGGLHLMFMQVETPFTEGAEVPVSLEFEKAGTVGLTMPVLPARTGRGADAHQH